jgi:hypothetical protein
MRARAAVTLLQLAALLAEKENKQVGGEGFLGDMGPSETGGWWLATGRLFFS